VVAHQSPREEPVIGEILAPEQIAERVGGISVKSLCELIRKNGLETTTLGYAAPSRRGGPPRRLWGMTELQLQRLLAFRQDQGKRRARSSAARPPGAMPGSASHQEGDHEDRHQPQAQDNE
jgi:hypothetical protein